MRAAQINHPQVLTRALETRAKELARKLGGRGGDVTAGLLHSLAGARGWEASAFH